MWGNMISSQMIIMEPEETLRTVTLSGSIQGHNCLSIIIFYENPQAYSAACHGRLDQLTFPNIHFQASVRLSVTQRWGAGHSYPGALGTNVSPGQRRFFWEAFTDSPRCNDLALCYSNICIVFRSTFRPSLFVSHLTELKMHSLVSRG